jgi:hypothetical protein
MPGRCGTNHAHSCVHDKVMQLPCRIIRTVAFMLTVLPSQRPGCFGRRFPPVPSSWWRFLVIGFTKLRAMGGWWVC